MAARKARGADHTFHWLVIADHDVVRDMLVDHVVSLLGTHEP